MSLVFTLFMGNRELLERFRGGQRGALEEVYRHYASDLAQFLQRGFSFQSGGQALRFGGYREPFDLENAVQETFFRAFRESARGGYDGLRPYRNYLFTIARNFVVDQLRGRETPMSPEVMEVAVNDALAEVTPSEDGEDSYLQKELADLLQQFVGKLDERERGFFVARFEEQRTQIDAGARCGMSHMQARTLEKKLRERLLKHMHESGYLGALPGVG